VSVAAYAYEIESDPVMSDAEFDALAQRVDLSIDTGSPVLDEFFRNEFDPYTGSWIYAHPELEAVGRVCRRSREKFYVDFEALKRKLAKRLTEMKQCALSLTVEPTMMETLFD